MPTDKQNLLIGEKDIQARFNMGKGVYNALIMLGMPVTKINGRIYGHYKNIDVWLQQLTAGGEYKDISEDEIEEG